MDLRDSGRVDAIECPLERLFVLAREADDHVAREIEVGERSESAQKRGRVVAPAHCPQDAVVARLQRDVEVLPDDRRLAQSLDEVPVDVVDLDRRQPQPCQPGDLTHGANEAGQRAGGLAVPVAAEVDPGQHDFSMALLDALPDLPQDRRGAPAP